MTNTQSTLASQQRVSTETKAAFKTTELLAYVAAVVGVLVASAVSDDGTGFGPKEAWFLVSILTIGYLVSRGLAKSGSRDFYDRGTDHGDHGDHGHR